MSGVLCILVFVVLCAIGAYVFYNYDINRDGGDDDYL